LFVCLFLCLCFYSKKSNQRTNKKAKIKINPNPIHFSQGHAAVFPLQPSCTTLDGKRQLATVAMVCNFSKPTESAPSLLRFNEG
jgi:Zn-dependent oligopeptidase